MNKYFAKLFVFVLTLFAAPFAAAAESVWAIYTPAAGSAIYDILTGVAGMMDRNGAASIIGAVLTVSLVSFIALVARAGIEGNFVRVLTFFLGLWVLLTTTFGIKVKVMVSDRVSNYYNVVENVPLILAAPAAFISEMGNQLADATDQFMTLPDGMSMRQGGQFNLFAKVLADSSTYRIVDPGLNQSVVNYVADCVIPGIAQGSISLAQLKTSKNLWKDMAFKHDALMTRVRLEPTMVTGIQNSTSATAATGATALSGLCSASDKSGCSESLMSCTNAHTAIGTALEMYAAEFGKGSGAMGDLAATGAASSLGNALSAASTWISGNGLENQASAGSVLQQRIMVNAITGAFRSAAVQAGNSELLQAAATTQAEEAQKSAWITSASLFNDLMGYIFIVLQAMIYAIAPFALLLLFAPGSGIRGAVSYLQMLIWVALWEPLLTIVNFMIAVLGKSSMVGAFGAGFDMTNAVTVSESANNLMAAAGFMGSMVPLIAWKIATGALGLMEFVQQGSGQAAATQAGATASSGNLSLGNVDMNKVNANSEKFTYNAEFGDVPLMHRKAAPGSGSVATDMGGSTTAINGSPMSYGYSTGVSSSNAAEAKLSMAYDTAKSLSMSSSQNAAKTQSEISQFARSTESGHSSTTTSMSQFSEGTQKQLSESIGAMRQSTAALGYAQQFKVGVGGSAGIGGSIGGDGDDSGGGKGLSLAAKITGGADMSRTTSLQDSTSDSVDLKNVASKSWQAIQQTTGAVSASFNEKTGMTFTMADGKSFTVGAQEVNQAAETYSRKIDAGVSERLSQDSKVNFQRALPVQDGTPTGSPGVGGSPALTTMLNSRGAEGMPQAMATMPKGTPEGYDATVAKARAQLDAGHVKGSPGTSGGVPANPTIAPSSEKESRRMMVQAAGPSHNTQVLSPERAARVDAQDGRKFERQTDGHTWNADNQVDSRNKTFGIK